MVKTADNAIDEGLKAAREAQRKAELIGDATQEVFNNVMKRLDEVEQSSKRSYEELARSVQRIAQGKPSDLVDEVAKNAKRLADAVKKISVEEANVKTLEKSLKAAKKRGASAEEVARIAQNLDNARKRLKRAKDTANTIQEVIDTATDVKTIRTLKNL